MSEGYISRQEHDEFCRRLDSENARQNRRIELLEEHIREIGSISSSVEKLAVNMESMLKEQERQGERLKTLEGRDGEKWRQVAGYTITAVISLVLGYLVQVIF
ncbi:MAG: hypothetical protein J1F28_04495 [Oscillospiraceae bacterium]|nr:hypothetical protein [Oscillospiraceae bacterium]